MSELRTDPLTGRQVYIAENRAARPNDFAATAPSATADDTPQPDCPFCPGNEHQTPDPTLERFDDAGRWIARAVPNKYPLLDAGAGQGIHEVIIESPRHVGHTSRLSVDQLATVLEVYAERLSAIAGDQRFPYRLLFKNVGPQAGASLSHLHSQLVALPEIPPLVANELENLASHNRQGGPPPWQAWVADLHATGGLIVEERNGIVACCPPVSRFSYETWILPLEPQPRFEDSLGSPEQLSTVASLLHRIAGFIESQLAADYNLMIHTAPSAPGVDRWYHWRIELTPRIGKLAGFEHATGLFINTVPPEHAAERLRAHLSAEP